MDGLKNNPEVMVRAEQILNGYVGEGRVSVKLSAADDKQIVIEPLVRDCTVEKYYLNQKSVLDAVKLCEEWRRPQGGLPWWRVVERVKRTQPKSYEIECSEGPASLSVQKGDVTFYLPGTIQGTANQIYNGFVTSKNLGKVSITNPMHIRLSLGQLQTTLKKLDK
jgi:hypothetical protein